MRGLLALALLLSACKPKEVVEDLGCTATGSGELDLDVDDFEGSWVVAPGVDVYDTSGELVATFGDSGTTTLPGGTYTVGVRRGQAAPDEFAGSTAGLLRDTFSEVCVPDGGTVAVNVTAEPQPSSGRLWAASGATFAGYGGLSDPGDEVEADAILTFPADIAGAAWDVWGNLWALGASGTFFVVEPADITGADAAKVLREVPAADLAGAGIADLDADEAGNFWVTLSDREDGFSGVVVFGVDELRATFSGSTELTPLWSGTMTGASHPARVMFDAEGGLYVSDPGADTVFHVACALCYLAAPLVETETSLTSDAAFQTTVDDGFGGELPLVGPTELAMDETGLWALYQESALAAHVSRSANGAVRSNFTASVDAGSVGLVRDGSNGLWVAAPGDSGATLSRIDAGTGMSDRATRLPELLSPTVLMFDPPVPLPAP